MRNADGKLRVREFETKNGMNVFSWMWLGGWSKEMRCVWMRRTCWIICLRNHGGSSVCMTVADADSLPPLERLLVEEYDSQAANIG